MSVIVDRKYLGLIQYRLESFVQKSPDLYNFRCPFCHDSKKSRSKKRGYIYRKVNDFFYRCHNCGVSVTFANFLKELDGNTYKEYVLENYSSGESGDHSHKGVEKPDFDYLKGNAFKHFNTPLKKLSLITVEELPSWVPAKTYILERGIPQEYWCEIYYAENFREFIRKDFPKVDKTDNELPNDERIVLCFTDIHGNITSVTGRSITNSKLRYVTIRVDEKETRKMYGTHRVNRHDIINVVEGQFDSMFLDNCIACGDAALTAAVDVFPSSELRLIFDNEPRNKQIVQTLERAIDAGHSVVIFPENIEQKDINDMVLAGIDVKDVISNHTYNGARAMINFIRWKRV